MDTVLEELAELRAYGMALTINMTEALKRGPHDFLIDIIRIAWEGPERAPTSYGTAPWCWCSAVGQPLPHAGHRFGG